MVFWIGDLNYRISDIDIESVKKLIEKKDYRKLQEYDQVSNLFILIYDEIESALLTVFPPPIHSTLTWWASSLR